MSVFGFCVLRSVESVIEFVQDVDAHSFHCDGCDGSVVPLFP